MSAKNKKLLAVLGAAAVVVIVIAAVLLGKGGQTTTVDPASTPSDVSAEDVDSSNTPDSSSSEPLVVVPDTSKPEATDSQNQTDAVLNVEEEDQVDVNLTDSEKKCGGRLKRLSLQDFKNGCSNGLRTAPKRQIRPVKRTGGDDGR